MRFFVLFCLSLAAVPQTTAPVKASPADPPALTADQKLKLREFQLQDSRVDAAIKYHQLEIVRLQGAQQKNQLDFNRYAETLCKPGKLDTSSDDFKCLPEEKPKGDNPNVQGH